MQFDRDEYKVVLSPEESGLALHVQTVTGWRSGELINDREDRGPLELPACDENGQLHLEGTALEGLARCIQTTQEIDLRQRVQFESNLRNPEKVRLMSYVHINNLRNAIENSREKEKIGKTILGFIETDKGVGFMKLDRALTKTNIDNVPTEPILDPDPTKVIDLAERREARVRRPKQHRNIL